MCRSMEYQPTLAKKVMALAGLRQYLMQPRSGRMPELLCLGQLTTIRNIRVRTDVNSTEFLFNVANKDGIDVSFTIEPDSLSIVMLIELVGQSIYIDPTNDGYLHVFRQLPIDETGGELGQLEAGESAGVALARILTRAGEGDVAVHEDKDLTNLKLSNLRLKKGKAKRTAITTIASMFHFLSQVSPQLFGEDLADAHTQVHDLIKRTGFIFE